MFNQLLVPVDGSPLSSACVQKAVTFAQEASAKICFFHAQPELPLPFMTEDSTLLEQARQMSQDASRRLLQSASDHARQKGVRHQILSLIGEPWEQIIRAAEQQFCDVIFMANHSRSVVTSQLPGSETQKVLAHSSIPVLVYR